MGERKQFVISFLLTEATLFLNSNKYGGSTVDGRQLYSICMPVEQIILSLFTHPVSRGNFNKALYPCYISEF
jgi:hypothetical protein